MISKEMYEFLKKIPRHPDTIPYKNVVISGDERAYHLYCEAKNDCAFINKSMERREDSFLSLTEKGQAAIEEYEQAKNNQATAKGTLIVSIVAIVLSVISIVMTLLSSCGGVQ